MRRTMTLSLATIALLGIAASENGTDPASEATPEPKLATLVGACTGPEPRVAPPRITVNGIDELQLRDPSGQAVTWTIEPKVEGAWPFASAAHPGNRDAAAATGRPQRVTLGGQPVQTGQVFQYKVTIVCPTGDPRVIDPEIVIGEM